MRVQIDCYPCILSQLSRLAKLATTDTEEQYRLIRRMLRKVVDADDRTTPPEFASVFNRIVSEVSGIDDAYQEVKDRDNVLCPDVSAGMTEEAYDLMSQKVLDNIEKALSGL